MASVEELYQVSGQTEPEKEGPSIHWQRLLHVTSGFYTLKFSLSAELTGNRGTRETLFLCLGKNLSNEQQLDLATCFNLSNWTN